MVDRVTLGERKAQTTTKRHTDRQTTKGTGRHIDKDIYTKRQTH